MKLYLGQVYGVLKLYTSLIIMTFYFQSIDSRYYRMQLEPIAFLNPSHHWIETLSLWLRKFGLTTNGTKIPINLKIFVFLPLMLLAKNEYLNVM